MTLISIGKSRVLAYAVLAAFAAFMMPGGLAAGAVDKGSLAGFVYAKDLKTPVAGAVVKIRSLSDLTELASLATDANGMFTITGIPEGRYMLGVTSAKDNFNLDYALYVKAGELGKLSISLAPGAAGGQESGETGAKKKGFFASTAGRILIIAAVGVGLFFLIVPHHEEASPIR